MVRTHYRLDERLRNILHVAIDEEIDIRLTKVGPWGQLCWAWKASDPAYRVASSAGSTVCRAGCRRIGAGSLIIVGPQEDGIHRTHTVHQRFQREPDSELNIAVTGLNYEPVALTEEGGAAS